MNNNTNPIELFIVALLVLVEGICWIINEVTGGHKEPIYTPPEIQPLFTELHALTVKELRVITGVTAKRYRKADLIQLAIA